MMLCNLPVLPVRATSQSDAYLKCGCQSAARNKQMLLHANLVSYDICNTVYLLHFVCRVQLLCMRQQRNVMRQWSNCFWSMEPTSRPGPNTYAYSLCAGLCTVFLDAALTCITNGTAVLAVVLQGVAAMLLLLARLLNAADQGCHEQPGPPCSGQPPFPPPT